MSCQDFAASLLDDRLAPPPGLQEHLAHCPACRAIAGLHASASSLRLGEPPIPAPIPREAILGEVRRRQRRRQQVVGLGATAALVLLAVLGSMRLRTSEAPFEEDTRGGVPVEGSARIVQAGEEAPSKDADEARSLGVLLQEVARYTRTRPGLEDGTYQSFGALASWVRLPDDVALDVFHLSRSSPVGE